MNTNWSDILSAFSVVLASAAVIYGVNAWRREFVGRRRIELAEETLILFYRARDAICRIRSPAGFSKDGQTRKAKPNETEDEKRVLDGYFVPIERYNKENDLFNDFRAIKYRFMAQFGSNQTEPFDQIIEAVNKVIFASHSLQTFNQSYPPGQIPPSISDKIERNYQILWDNFSPQDPINPLVDSAIESIEKKCRELMTIEPSFLEKVL